MDTEEDDGRLAAFCSITLDNCFVIRDLKIIRSKDSNGRHFVSMPSRKLMDRCDDCGCKNHLRACFCNQCGRKLDGNRATRDAEGRIRLYADIAHPITNEKRRQMELEILFAYIRELERSKQAGYICTYDDYDTDVA